MKKDVCFADTRDRDEDLKKVADAFLSFLTMLPSKKGKEELWGIDRKQPLGDSDDLLTNILETIGALEPERCPHCDEALSDAGYDDEMIDYARDLWQSLGLFMEQRWYDLHEKADAEEEEEQEETEEHLCGKCDAGLEDDGTCFYCDDDEQDATCENCDNDVDECECEDETCEGCEEFVDECSCDEDEEEEYEC